MNFSGSNEASNMFNINTSMQVFEAEPFFQDFKIQPEVVLTRRYRQSKLEMRT